EKLSSVTVVGGTKRVERDQIAALKPDLILAEKEENPQEIVYALAELAPVYVTDVTSIPSAISMCKEVGRLMGLVNESEALSTRIEVAMNGVKRLFKSPERVLYLIWRKPRPLQWMAAGKGTFIHSCLEHIGLRNVVTLIPESTGPTI